MGDAGSTDRDALLGALLVLASSVGFGSVVILARVAYDGGSNAPTSLFFRFAIGSLLFWLLLRLRGMNARLPREKIATFVLMGVLFAGLGTTSFMSIERIPASLSAIVFYVYPAIVTVGAALIFKTRFTAAQVAILITSIGGCALTVDVATGRIDPFGMVLALLAPLLYSAYVLLGSRALIGVPPLVASTWITTTAAPLMLIAGLTGMLGHSMTLDIDRTGWLAILGLAIFSTVISISTFLAGMARLDPFRAAILTTIEPVITIILAILFLHEVVTHRQFLGAGLIVGSTIALQLLQRRNNRRERTRAGASTSL